MKITIPLFSGEQPKVSPTLLKDGMAQHAVNCKIESGDLAPWAMPTYQEASALSTIKSLFQHVENGNNNWVTLEEDMDIASSPVDNDT
jgi:hypothetical protein